MPLDGIGGKRMKSNQNCSWVRVFLFSLFITGLSLNLAPSVFGQAEDPKPKTEAEVLKERLQQLELTVTALKSQLDALEEAKKNPKTTIIDAVYEQPSTAATEPS